MSGDQNTDSSHIFIGALLGAVIFSLSLLTGRVIYEGRAAVADEYDVIQPASMLEKPAVATVLIVGDMMFDRSVRTLMRDRGGDYPFAGMADFMSAFDAVFANLEGPVTTFTSVAVPNGSLLQFTFDQSVPALLKKNNITLVSLANNHTGNFGSEGLLQTKTFLADAGVEYVGDPENRSDIGRIVQVNGVSIGVVGYHDFAIGLDRTLVAITELRQQVPFVIVLPHWGVEYSHTPTTRQRDIAQQFITAGADLVVGAHPHVVQTVEKFQHKRIYYSLGNFIFDQWFSMGVKCGQGLILTLTEQGRGTQRTLLPTYETVTFYSERAQPVVDTEYRCN